MAQQATASAAAWKLRADSVGTAASTDFGSDVTSVSSPRLCPTQKEEAAAYHDKVSLTVDLSDVISQLEHIQRRYDVSKMDSMPPVADAIQDVLRNLCGLCVDLRECGARSSFFDFDLLDEELEEVPRVSLPRGSVGGSPKTCDTKQAHNSLTVATTSVAVAALGASEDSSAVLQLAADATVRDATSHLQKTLQISPACSLTLWSSCQSCGHQELLGEDEPMALANYLQVAEYSWGTADRWNKIQRSTGLLVMRDVLAAVSEPEFQARLQAVQSRHQHSQLLGHKSTIEMLREAQHSVYQRHSFESSLQGISKVDQALRFCLSNDLEFLKLHNAINRKLRAPLANYELFGVLTAGTCSCD